MHIGDCKGGECKGMRDENLPIGYNVHYSSDGYTKIPDFTNIQFTYVLKNYTHKATVIKKLKIYK